MLHPPTTASRDLLVRSSPRPRGRSTPSRVRHLRPPAELGQTDTAFGASRGYSVLKGTSCGRTLSVCPIERGSVRALCWKPGYPPKETRDQERPPATQSAIRNPQSKTERPRPGSTSHPPAPVVLRVRLRRFSSEHIHSSGKSPGTPECNLAVGIRIPLGAPSISPPEIEFTW